MAGGDEVVRVRLSRAKGWKMPENTVVVSRPTKWGNPFIVGKDGTREECARLFALMLNGQLALTCTPSVEELRAYRKFASANIGKLKGKNLACWCALPKPGEIDHCHAAVLLSTRALAASEAAQPTAEGG